MIDFMRTRAARAAVLSLGALAVFGCAPKTGPRAEDYAYGEAYDPIESINRPVFVFNEAVDKIALAPAARAYRKIPVRVRSVVGNFLSNLGEPKNAMNNALQGKIGDAATSVGRFAANSLLGLAGAFDFAESRLGWKQSEEDLGQTFRKWGANDTAYVVLPLLGPSTVTDAAGSTGDSFVTPLHWNGEDRDSHGLFSKVSELRWSESDDAVPVIIGVGVVDARARFAGAEELLEGATLEEDRYVLLRDLYWEQRKSLAADGADDWEIEE